MEPPKAVIRASRRRARAFISRAAKELRTHNPKRTTSRQNRRWPPPLPAGLRWAAAARERSPSPREPAAAIRSPAARAAQPASSIASGSAAARPWLGGRLSQPRRAGWLLPTTGHRGRTRRLRRARCLTAAAVQPQARRPQRRRAGPSSRLPDPRSARSMPHYICMRCARARCLRRVDAFGCLANSHASASSTNSLLHNSSELPHAIGYTACARRRRRRPDQPLCAARLLPGGAHRARTSRLRRPAARRPEPSSNSLACARLRTVRTSAPLARRDDPTRTELLFRMLGCCFSPHPTILVGGGVRNF